MKTNFLKIETQQRRESIPGVVYEWNLFAENTPLKLRNEVIKRVNNFPDQAAEIERLRGLLELARKALQSNSINTRGEALLTIAAALDTK